MTDPCERIRIWGDTKYCPLAVGVAQKLVWFGVVGVGRLRGAYDHVKGI